MGCRGRWLADGKERAAARSLAGGGEHARGRGGRGGAEAAGPGPPAPALHSEPSRGCCTPAADLGRNFLGSRAPEKSAQPSDYRRRGPSPAPRAQGLPLRGAGSAPDFPAGRSRGPGRRAGSPPGGRGERGLRGPEPPGPGSALPAEAGPAPEGWQTPRRDPQSGARRAADEESCAAARAARALRGAGRAPSRSEAPARRASARRGARRTQRSRRWRSRSPRARQAAVHAGKRPAVRCGKGALAGCRRPQPPVPGLAARRRPSSAPASETS